MPDQGSGGRGNTPEGEMNRLRKAGYEKLRYDAYYDKQMRNPKSTKQATDMALTKGISKAVPRGTTSLPKTGVRTPKFPD
jgi:hypothetical protein